ncbi:MAG TPA: hypothetical protein VFK88_13075 [Gallionella sp.]|nr:hypothetical protein [Gallionella sp.]
MTDPLKIVFSLNTVSSGYTVFEKDQVLTEKQLNELTSYLDDQNRLTRVTLLGVGIVGGLRVAVAGNKVNVSKGVGITTDGDLLMLSADTTYDRVKLYDASAPVYPPFYKGETMLTLYELIAEGESDVRAQSMDTLPGALAGYVVLMLMESYQKHPDLCSGTDCDNLGQDVVNTVRLLLVAPKDAASLLASLACSSNTALGLPELFADRPQLGSSITGTNALAAQYRNACNNIHASLAANLGLLYARLPQLFGGLFNNDPSPGWITRLNAIKASFASRNAGIQYYYNFLKDVVETWNALREILFEDDSVLCPDFMAFPKHLLLGSLANPVEMRTGLYPSPLTGNSKGIREHARFLVWKLHILINTFSDPKDTAITITPSRGESTPLEERAIPYYYAIRGDLPIHRGWNYRLAARGAEGRNLGYRAAEYGAMPGALRPFGSQIGRYDFFRIEGHLGQNVDAVTTALKNAVAANNLGIAIRAVLLHTDRRRIVIRPPFRYTPLHGLHYLLRKDVATQLEDGKTFNLSFRDRINGAVSREVPEKLNGKNTTDVVRDHYEKVDAAIAKASAPLGATRYSEYRSTLTSASGNWKSAYRDTVDAAGTFKLNFGAMVRTDFSTPFDSLMTSNHSFWLDWLDELIDRHDAREDDKLLFPNFIATHPGLEHFGGAPAGGTFVLVYDDSSQVVADFMLPYFDAEESEAEPEEPPLSRPPYKPPMAIDHGFTLLPPIDIMFTNQLDDFKKRIQPEWEKEINIQKDYQSFFVKSLDAFNSIFTAKNAGVGIGITNAVTGGYTDPMLNIMMSEIASKQQQLEQLQLLMMQPDTPEAVRATAQGRIATVQQDLARSTLDSAQYVAQQKVDVSAGSDGSRALTFAAAAMGKVNDAAAKANLKTGLDKLANIATGEPQKAAINNMIRMTGF